MDGEDKNGMTKRIRRVVVRRRRKGQVSSTPAPHVSGRVRKGCGSSQEQDDDSTLGSHNLGTLALRNE